MSLRDYFAAKAMQGMLASATSLYGPTIAFAAYQRADEMIAAREAKP
jgi:hypothetical protein